MVLIKASTLAHATVFSFVLALGCTNTRYVAQPQVTNLGDDINTRYKYKFIDCYINENGNYVKNDWLYRSLKNDMEYWYPEIFGDDGIPFVLRQVTIRDGRIEYDSFDNLAWLCSAFIYPATSKESVWSDYLIEFPGDKTVTKSFAVHYMNDEAIAFLARKWYNDAPENMGSTKYFWKTSTHPRIEINNTDRFSVNRRAIAYGVAVKLKELEETLISYGKYGESVSGKSPLYTIISCERDSGSSFEYRFKLRLNDEDNSLKAFRIVQQDFRKAIKEDYLEAFPDMNQMELYVDFPEYKLVAGTIDGRASVLMISPISLEYNPDSRKGRMSVKIGQNQYEKAREWIRQNIAILARDANIALQMDMPTPEGRFYMRHEEMKSGILEVEFETE